MAVPPCWAARPHAPATPPTCGPRGRAHLRALVAAATADAGSCTNVVTGYSGAFGTRITGRLDRFNNQTAQWQAKGAITKVVVYYNSTSQCVQGLKITYGAERAEHAITACHAACSMRWVAGRPHAPARDDWGIHIMINTSKLASKYLHLAGVPCSIYTQALTRSTPCCWAPTAPVPS